MLLFETLHLFWKTTQYKITALQQHLQLMSAIDWSIVVQFY